MKKKQPFKKVTVKKGTAIRLLRYVLKRYYKYFIVVVLLILVSSFVNVESAVFFFSIMVQFLYDYYA